MMQSGKASSVQRRGNIVQDELNCKAWNKRNGVKFNSINNKVMLLDRKWGREHNTEGKPWDPEYSMIFPLLTFRNK